ncbi:MAG TPA: hypothetical protein VN625_05920, partial [Desulfuromonadaceae bacterium]|nr:hypothetical protein [Desulfuromonadaceae bacterium]
MNRRFRTLRSCLVLAFFTGAMVHAQILRVPNTSLTNLPPQPPQLGYTIANALPGVSLTSPVCITSPRGETNRLFILEQGGNIVVITNLASPTRTVFMSLSVLSDGESGLLGLAFHPGYATNGYFYVFSS